MKATKKIPFHEAREKPFSGKQKKIQLQDSRERKRDEEEGKGSEGEKDVEVEEKEVFFISQQQQQKPKTAAPAKVKVLSQKQRMKRDVASCRAELFKNYKPLSKLQSALLKPQIELEAWKQALRQLAEQLAQISEDVKTLLPNQGSDSSVKAQSLSADSVGGGESSSATTIPTNEAGREDRAEGGQEEEDGEEEEIHWLLTAGVKNEIYQLVQLALQSGPLRGSDPGYFKRATTTAEVIEAALEFLKAVVPMLPALGLSANQCQRGAKWLSDAENRLEKIRK